MGRRDVVKHLFGMGCLPGRALFFAIKESQLEVIQFLLQHCGVNINQRWAGHPAMTPLEFAVLRGNVPVAKLLLDDKYHVDIKRPLSPYLCGKYSLPPDATVAHLTAKLGGNRAELLGRVRNKDDAKLAKMLLKVGA